ncbi:MAG: ECF-type sigma factor [Novipirellula sp. JB048]
MESGEPDAAARLFEAVYSELRTIAAGKMSGERQNHTLQPTALVNEAFLRLVGNIEDFSSRSHFFGAAARAMERVLVDHARERNAQKRGGGIVRVTFDELRDVIDRDSSPGTGGGLDVVAVHEALARLESQDERLARVVRYRYFVGTRLEDIAEVTGDSLSTVRRQWAFARAWLHTELADSQEFL